MGNSSWKLPAMPVSSPSLIAAQARANFSIIEIVEEATSRAVTQRNNRLDISPVACESSNRFC
jgi:hypothetical protein